MVIMMTTEKDKNTIKISRSLFLEDWDIEAFVDNELDWEDEKYVRNLLKYDPKSEKHYQTLRRQKQLINMYWNDKQSQH